MGRERDKQISQATSEAPICTFYSEGRCLAPMVLNHTPEYTTGNNYSAICRASAIVDERRGLAQKINCVDYNTDPIILHYLRK